MPAARLALSAVLIALAAPVAAVAQSGSASQPKRDDSTSLSGVTVVAPNSLSELVVSGRRRCILDVPPGERRIQPRVVSTYPEAGGVAPPGRFYIRVTFDQRMSPCGFLIADTMTAPEPDFLDEPALLTRDYKTFYFAVNTLPGTSYGVRFNTLFAHNFRSLYGAVSPAYTLSFKTSEAAPRGAMTEAMAGDRFSQDVAQHPERLLVLWTPRENGEGPDCGSCDDTHSSLKMGEPLKPLTNTSR